MLDGKHAANTTGAIPISNGTVNTDLNADKLDGYHASSFVRTVGSVAPDASGNVNVDLSSRVAKSGDTMTGDLTIYRAASPTTGVVFLGNSGGRYLYYDGDSYVMHGANLYVNGNATFTTVSNCQGTINTTTGSGNIPTDTLVLVKNGNEVQLRTNRALSNCNCDCFSCFPAGCMVLMADGSERRIETVQAGEFVMGADGTPAEVDYLHISHLGFRTMYRFNDGHEWSEEHMHWVRKDGSEWWWSANPDTWRNEVAVGVVAGLKDNYSVLSGGDVEYAHMDGFANRVMEQVDRPSDTKVYLPITSGVPIIVDGYVVGASVNEFGYDYTQFRWNPEIVKEKCK